MTPQEYLASLKSEAGDLLAKAMNHPSTFTQVDAERSTFVATEAARVKALVEQQEATTKTLSGLSGVRGGISSTPDQEHDEDDFGRSGVAKSRSSSRFTRNVMKAFKAAAPAVGGPFVQKALIPNGAIVAEFDQAIIEDPMDTTSLYNVVNHATASGNAGTYLAQIERTNNAATVKAGDLKPFSSYGLEQRSWRLATVAHLAGPMKRQWLQDHSGLNDFLYNEMAYGIDRAVSDLILNGGKDEDGGTITGIMNTSGISQTAYTTSPLRTIRRAITQQQTIGANPKNIVLNPDDWESIENTLTASGEYIMDGAPQKAVTPQLYGMPVTLVTGLPAGQAIIGNLQEAVTVLDNSQLEVVWHEGGQVNVGTKAAPVLEPLFQANQLIVRAEMRLGLTLNSLKQLRIADLTAA